MPTLWFDTETYSECDLFKAGTHAYAEHPSTEIILAQWQLDDGPVHVEDLFGRLPPSGELIELLDDPDVGVDAHNSPFDRTLIRHVWGLDVAVCRWQDTMIKALSHGLPGALGKLGDILKIKSDAQKDKRGKELIQLFCKPRPKNHALRRATPATHPTEWIEFKGYGRQDIPAMRAVHDALPAWNYCPGHPELALWHLDQRINDRGFAVDVELAHAAVAAVKQAQSDLRDQVVAATDGVLTNVSQRDKLLTYILAEYGVTLPDMKADTLRRRADDPDLPDAVRLLIEIRLESTRTSTAKYNALLRAVSSDGRMRNTMQFAGALRTARWAGRLFQPQNMPRPDMAGDDIEVGIEALKAGCADVLGDVMRLTANAVRGCIVAPAGKKLCIADLSNIEGRGLAYLASERWKLKAFAEFDAGRGVDLYKLAYARAFNLDAATVTKYQRQQGKVMELGCLAGDTPVVTSNGIKAIMAVSCDDKLWDGETWVTHKGLVPQGVKLVVRVAGIELTPDHLVRTGQTWTQAQELASCESTLCQALGTALENSPSWLARVSEEERATRTWHSSSAPAVPLPTLCTPTTCAREQAHGATHAQKSRPPTGEKTSGPTPTLFPTMTTVGGCSTESAHASTVVTTRTTQASQTTAGGGSSCSNPGEKTDGPFCGTWPASKDGTVPCLNSTEGTSTEGTNQGTYASSLGGRTRVTDGLCRKCSSEYPTLKPTFDILNAGPRNRFTVLTERGPLIVHNCGYEGGVAAFVTFAAVYGMDLTELADAVWGTASREALENAQGMLKWTKKKGRSTLGLEDRVWVACEVLKRAWRDAHPNTEALWKAAGEAVRQAVASPGQTFSAGEHLRVRVDGSWLRVRLPSGRYLCYSCPEVADDGQISYLGVDQYTRQWKRVKTYGGKLVENATQAFARDIMAANMQPAEDAGYAIVLSVHDELLTETPDTDDYSHEALATLMATVPPWAKGIPLAAAGFETTRYRKE